MSGRSTVVMAQQWQRIDEESGNADFKTQAVDFLISRSKNVQTHAAAMFDIILLASMLASMLGQLSLTLSVTAVNDSVSQ